MSQSFMQKLCNWCGAQPTPGFVKTLNDVIDSYKRWGHTDAQKGKQPAEDSCFLTGAGFCFPDAPEMAAAMAEHIKACYMSSYNQIC